MAKFRSNNLWMRRNKICRPLADRAAGLTWFPAVRGAPSTALATQTSTESQLRHLFLKAQSNHYIILCLFSNIQVAPRASTNCSPEYFSKNNLRWEFIKEKSKILRNVSYFFLGRFFSFFLEFYFFSWSKACSFFT